MMNVFEIILQYRKELFAGFTVTLQMCSLVYPLGIVFGTLLGIASHRWKLMVGIPIVFLSLILSSIPIIVFLFWLHYPLQYLLGVVIDPFRTSTFALSVIMVFMISEIIRNALNNFPKELLQAAKVCGISRRKSIMKIELPLIYRQVMPGILVAMINILQATLFTSLISVNEIFRVAQQINAEIYKPVEVYTALAVFFIVICVGLSLFAYWLKSKYKWSLADL